MVWTIAIAVVPIIQYPDHSKTDLQNVWVLNVWFSDFHCNELFFIGGFQAKKSAQSKPAAQPAAKTAPPPPAPKPIAAPIPRPVLSTEDRTEPLKGIMKAMTKTM